MVSLPDPDRWPAVRPGRRFTWTSVALLLITAGSLAGASWMIRWWGVCLPFSLDTEACGIRQSSESSLAGDTVLPDDLRLAAILLAASQLVAAVLWCVAPWVVTGPRWLRSLLVLGSLYPALLGVSELAWRLQGRDVAVAWIATVPTGAVAYLALLLLGGLAAVRVRVGALLLLVGITSTTMLAVVVDWFLWNMVTDPWDYPPGVGSTAPVGLLATGGAILLYSLRRHRGHGWRGDPHLAPPPLSLLVVAPGTSGENGPSRPNP